MTIAALVPIRTISEPNDRAHWSHRTGLQAEQRTLARVFAQHAGAGPESLPCRVQLIRLAMQTLDTDNLAAALKHIRDGTADALGLRDDSDPRVAWSTSQAKLDSRFTACGRECALPAYDRHAVWVLIEPA